MISIRSLHIYPVKSCRGIDVTTAEVVTTGFRYDRRWMLVDADRRFLSQRGHPVLARVRTRIENGCLLLDTPGRKTLEVSLNLRREDPRSVIVWNDTCVAISEGPEAAEWFSAVLGTPCELVRQPEDEIRQVDPRYAEEGDRVAFADGFPFLLISQASVDELNRRLAEPVSEDRFRANIVVDGCQAHDEDAWSTITMGGVDFLLAKPCARCVVIATDQDDGTRSPEPLQTLAGYRTTDGKVLFGQNLVHRGAGVVRVGDDVHVTHRE